MATAEQQLKLEIATPEGMALSTIAQSVQAPSVEGELGVLPGHLPLLAALRPGLLKYKVEGHDQLAVIDKGFIEVGPDRVLILTDLFKAPGEVEAASARKALVDAEEALKSFQDPHVGQRYEELRRDVEWAAAQLELLEQANRP